MPNTKSAALQTWYFITGLCVSRLSLGRNIYEQREHIGIHPPRHMFGVTNWITTSSKARNRLFCSFFLYSSCSGGCNPLQGVGGAHKYESYVWHAFPSYSYDKPRDENENSPFSPLNASQTSSWDTRSSLPCQWCSLSTCLQTLLLLRRLTLRNLLLPPLCV